MKREDLLKRLEEMQEPQLQYLAMINEAFLQSMEIIGKVARLADMFEKGQKAEYSGRLVAMEIRRALDHNDKS